MPGVPVIPIVFALFSVAIALNEIRTNPVNASIGLLLVLIGLPVYWIWLRGTKPPIPSKLPA
jgi:APA family basic amino acid/polyamine antiporter